MPSRHFAHIAVVVRIWSFFRARCGQGLGLRGRFELAVAFVVLTLVSHVSAQQTHRVALKYETHPDLEGCPTRLEFESGVRRQLGYDPFSEERPTHRVLVRATPNDAGIGGSLMWSDASGRPQGERLLQARRDDCAQLGRSMVFAMVVQLQLLDGASSGDPVIEDEPAPQTTTNVSQPEVVSDLPRDPPETADTTSVQVTRAPQLYVGLGPGVASGLAPDMSLLGRGFAALHLQSFALEAGIAASWPTTWRDAGARGFRSNVLLGSFSPCVLLKQLSACDLVHLGRLYVEGTGVDVPRSSSGFVGQAGLRLGVSEPIGPIVGSLHLGVLQSFTGWTVEVDGEGVWTSPETNVQFGLDVALPIPIDQ